jgi:hypothetical protein
MAASRNEYGGGTPRNAAIGVARLARPSVQLRGRRQVFQAVFKSPRPNIRPEDYTIRQIDEANQLVNYSLKFVPNFRYCITRSSQLEPVEVP